MQRVSNDDALSVLYRICAAFLEFGQTKSNYSETELADGMCMELLVNDMRITIETGPEVKADIEASKAIEKASH